MRMGVLKRAERRVVPPWYNHKHTPHVEVGVGGIPIMNSPSAALDVGQLMMDQSEDPEQRANLRAGMIELGRVAGPADEIWEVVS